MVERMPITPSSLPSERAIQSAPNSFLHGGGQLGELIRAFDWSTTPLGPMEAWPQSLKTTISLMLNSQHPMWVGWGPEITFLYNDAYIHVLGQAKHPWALGLPAEAVWAEIWHYCGPLAINVFQQGQAVMIDDVQLFMRRAPDFLEEVFYSFSYSPVRDESGAVGGLFCPSSDVTAKTISARRLKTLSELAAKALVQKTPATACATAAAILERNLDDIPFALLYLTDPNGDRVALESFTRLPDDSPLAAPVIETGPGAPGGIWEIGEVLAQSRSRIVGTRKLDFPFKGAADQPIGQAIVLPLTAHDQERPIGVLVAGVNPTRRLDEDYQTFFQLVAGQIATAIANARAAEEDRKRAEALAALDRAKTTFFSNVSHELRTPLTLMLGPLEDIIARSENEASADQRELATVAHRNGQRLLKLVNTLLDFSRIEAGRIEACFEPTDLASYTTELASVFRSAAEKAGLKMEVDCPPLPAAVYVDREMWEKLVLNLLSNAFKFTFDGGITVTQRWHDDAIELSVRDTGVGIPSAELPRIFERFHRIRGTRSRTHEGTGIGLALVQELARLHGGEVQAESEEGRGTKFTVRIRTGKAHLPKEQIHDDARSERAVSRRATAFIEEAARWLPDDRTLSADPDKALSAPNSGQSSAPPDAPSILLADDNVDMRNYVRRLLSPNYRVYAVADGEEALAAIQKQQPDLVLTDVMMPRLNGFELLARLRADAATRTLPVVMLSARAGEEARVEGLDAGADDYLIKPFSARELLARVASQLAMAKLRREGEDQITRLLGSITDGFLGLDQDWRLTYINPAARRMLGAQGLDADQLLGKNFLSEALPEPPGSISKCELQRAMEERTAVVFEDYYQPWRRWYVIRAYPVQEGGLSIFFQDITARKDAEEALRRSDERVRQTNVELSRRIADLQSLNTELQESRQAALKVLADSFAAREALRRRTEQFETLLNNTPLGIYLVDSDLCIREVNPTARPIFGDMPDLIGRNFEDVIHVLWPKAHADDIVRKFRLTLLTGEPYSSPEWIEERLDRGTTEYYQWRIDRITLPDGSYGVVCYFRDIASDVKARQALHDAKEQAETASRAKDRFLAQLSHELRTPLTPVLMTASALHEDERLPEDVRTNLGMIKHNVSLEARLIDDLLDLTRIVHGKLAIRVEECDVHSTIGNVLEIVRDDAQEKGIQISLDLEAEHCCLQADLARMQQVFWNLLRNAVKFTPRGGKIEIHSRDAGEPGDPRLRVEVTDNGLGFDQAAAERIFKPFEQDAQPASGGLGLGLAIARAIVELHEGTVTASSPGAGQGATFAVEFPGAKAPHAALTAAPTRPLSGHALAAGETPLRLLVVEDHESTLQVLVRLLTRAGYQVTDAKTVTEARTAAATKPFDLVISDLGLPDGTGIELMKSLRAQYGLKGVALSGYGMEEDIHRSHAAGFVAHLVKPIDVAELRRTIARIQASALENRDPA